MTTVSIVVVTYNNAGIIEPTLRALAAQTLQPDQVVVFDNASKDDTVAIVRSVAPDARIVRSAHNRGFAGGANAAVAASSSDLVCVLNSDARPERGWLAALRAGPRDSDIWAWGSIQVRAGNGLVESAGDLCSPLGLARKHLRDQPLALNRCQVVVL